MEEKNVLLASTSPRRREMLSWLMSGFGTYASDIDESVLENEEAIPYVIRMAESKALKAIEEVKCYPFILSSDTIVVYEGEILGKPLDSEHARKMLQRLRGKIHKVFTAVTVAKPQSGIVFTVCCVAEVPMRQYSDEEIEAYILSGDPFDKAGSYAIQNESFHPVEHFSGCFACVMGLPLCHVIRHMKKLDLPMPDDPKEICYEHLDYDCEISSSVLSFRDQITC
jgi:septum formation protein